MVVKRIEEAKLGSFKVCPECGSRVLKWIEHPAYGYFLCYGCGWASMTPREIGKAMAKEVGAKLKLNFSMGK